MGAQAVPGILLDPWWPAMELANPAAEDAALTRATSPSMPIRGAWRPAAPFGTKLVRLWNDRGDRDVALAVPTCWDADFEFPSLRVEAK